MGDDEFWDYLGRKVTPVKSGKKIIEEHDDKRYTTVWTNENTSKSKPVWHDHHSDGSDTEIRFTDQSWTEVDNYSHRKKKE